jgi:Asp/Glu/hydantoin racemase
MQHAIACIHTSPAALGPVAQYYGANAPELEITNLLDDGLLRWFAADRPDAVQARLAEMLRAAREWYGAEAALLTCSSISRPVLESVRANAGIPVMKIDEPMARTAIAAGQRVGVAVTFASTLEPTSRLLRDAAAEVGREIDLVPRVVDGAYDALLGGDPARHDALLAAGVEELAAVGVDVVVLAQVSMARVLPLLEGRVAVPVLSSLDTSLAALRQVLDHPAPGAAADMAPRAD